MICVRLSIGVQQFIAEVIAHRHRFNSVEPQTNPRQ